MNSRYYKYIVLFFVALILVSVGSLFLGSAGIANWEIIYKIRLPRVLLGVVVGCGLSVSGAIFQGITKNPLADPYILGASGGAAVGVATGVILKLPYGFIYPLAVAGSIISTLIVFAIGRINGRTKVEVMILAGVIVNTFTSAIVLLLMSLFFEDSHDIMFFLMGSLQENNLNLLMVSGILVLSAFIFSMVYSSELNILAQGEETAYHLGVNVEKTKWVLFSVSSLLVGATVSVSGAIGFIGLIIPHISRIFVGANHKRLIPASFLLGGTFMVIADTISRTLFAPLEIPVGVVTALAGVPFFVYLLTRNK